MASGRRASMREGPLAALFRRTDEDAPAAADVTAQAAAEAAEAAARAATPAAEPAPPVHPRESGAPHPSLLAPEPPVEEPATAVPSPQERLRAAFSSDIPDNILEPPRRTSRHV
jgi:cell division protein FtsZ